MADPASATSRDEAKRRWRLLLGEPAANSLDVELSQAEVGMDRALGAVYDPDSEPDEAPGARKGGLGSSAPQVARWLGDIRTYFPTSVVRVLQRDAIERLHLTSLLLEPELLSTVQPDVELAATLVSLNKAMPEGTKATARLVIGQVVADIERRIATRTRAEVSGALNRASRTRRPRPADIDWQATIGRNLKNYLPERRTVVPERLVGYRRASRAFDKDVIVAVDQSGSMAESLVYAAVFGATLASIRTLKTSLIAFDTEVVDLTDKLSDPVDVLFGCQLGGGTDINRAIAYCQQLVTRPNETVLVLISDLFEGGVPGEMLRRIRDLVQNGVTVIALLALSDSGAPSYDHEHAATLAEFGVPVFGCTPDHFPELLAVALSGGDVAGWAAQTAAAAASTS
jgi:VWA domain containing CoxE-like protein